MVISFESESNVKNDLEKWKSNLSQKLDGYWLARTGGRRAKNRILFRQTSRKRSSLSGNWILDVNVIVGSLHHELGFLLKFFCIPDSILWCWLLVLFMIPECITMIVENYTRKLTKPIVFRCAKFVRPFLSLFFFKRRRLQSPRGKGKRNQGRGRRGFGDEPVPR